MLSHILSVYFCNSSHVSNSFIFFFNLLPVTHSQATMYKIATAKTKQKLLQLEE